MAKYKLQQKTNEDGTTQDIKLDASSVDLSNYVDKTTNQTISGTKHFSSYIYLDSTCMYKKNPNYAYTDTPSMNLGYSIIELIDKNNSSYSSIGTTIGNDSNSLYFSLKQKDASTRFYRFDKDSFVSFGGSPLGDVNLGEIGNKWKDLYMSGSIKDGTNTFTLPSTSGTLALQSEIPSISNLVDLTSAQEISGQKTFTTSSPIIAGQELKFKEPTKAYTDTPSIDSTNVGVYFRDKNNILYASLTGIIGNSKNYAVLGVVEKDRTGRHYLFEKNAFYPVEGGFTDLGVSTYKWRDLYLSGSIKDGTNTFTLPSTTGTFALTSDLSNYVDKTSTQSISGVKTFTNGISVSGRSVGGGDDEGIVVGVASNNYAGVCCGSPSGRRAVFYLKPSATSGNSVWRYNNGSTTYDIAHPEKAGTIALTSDMPTESTISGWGFTKNTGTITEVQLNGSSIATSGVANVKALPNFNLNISHQTSGNPRQVKFLTVDYNTSATYFKMSATSCHDNGTSYQFLEDIIIGCTTGGSVVCNVYKYCQQAVTLDNVSRNYGDVFYVKDTTNKKVDFYILCGQYASSQFTPATKIGNTTIAYITQYTGTATYYSSGTKVWADGNSSTFSRGSDMQFVAQADSTRVSVDTLFPSTSKVYLVVPYSYGGVPTIRLHDSSSSIKAEISSFLVVKRLSSGSITIYGFGDSAKSTITNCPTLSYCRVYLMPSVLA